MEADVTKFKRVLFDSVHGLRIYGSSFSAYSSPKLCKLRPRKVELPKRLESQIHNSACINGHRDVVSKEDLVLVCIPFPRSIAARTINTP